MEFKEFPKIARYSRQCIITEKIDGTNASIYIGPDGEFLTGSRTRWITPDDDNFGFSRWAHDHKESLMQLGPGHHFGEWWGKGIQRNYGLSDRRWSLFNTIRWCEHYEQPLDIPTADPRITKSQTPVPPCCYVVPVLYRGVFGGTSPEVHLDQLRIFGSRAEPGFMKPEGVVIFHVAANVAFKKTIEKDDEPKGAKR